ncbi:MAG: cob(I)yrinic acid a,c-diamide adenosyltransferase [Desulfobacterales bacterium]|nr:cob(I)yrinic acid a,c-diamide adenosyltransferase [Desulfobacterales bacterium]
MTGIDKKIVGDGSKTIPFRPKSLQKVYTRKGDLGQCNLLSGERIMKDADQVEAAGDIDELNTVLGVLVSVLPQRSLWLSGDIERIQQSLFQVGAMIASDPMSPAMERLKSISKEDIQFLEQSIDSMEERLPLIQNFIIAKGHVSAAQAQFARCVCRRAERHVIRSLKNYNLLELPEPMKNVLAYLNRLSDYLFVLGRFCDSLQNEVGLINSFETLAHIPAQSSLTLQCRQQFGNGLICFESSDDLITNSR